MGSTKQKFLPQGVDHGEPEKLSLTEKKLSVASILMPQPDLPFEGGIKIDATRLKPAFVLAFGAKTEPTTCVPSHLAPKRSQSLTNLLPHLYRNLRVSKTTFIFKIS